MELIKVHIMKAKRDPYTVLGVDKEASAGEIKKKYYQVS